MPTLTLQNGHLGPALKALAALTAEDVRLPAPVAIRAYRAKQAVAEAWKPVSEAEIRTIRQHGGKLTEDGGWTIGPEQEGYTEVREEIEELRAGTVDLDLQPIPWSGIEAASRPVEIGADHLGVLVETGIIQMEDDDG